MYIHQLYIHGYERKDTALKKTLTRDARQSLDSCPAGALRAAARELTRYMEAALAPTGLSYAQFNLMLHLAAAQDDRIAALSRRTGLEASTLSRNLRTLERAGLVEITMVETDLRQRAVWLTEQGARRLEAALPCWQAACAGLAGTAGPILDSTADQARRLAMRLTAPA